MEILVINLEKDTERRKKIESQLSYNRLNYKIIKGVDGSNTKVENVTEMCKLICTDSMIGIMASHIKCWQYVADNDLEYAVILEDDAVLSENFEENVNILIKSLNTEPWDVLLLGCFLCVYDDNDFFSKLIMKINNPFKSAEDEKYNDLLYKPNSWAGAHAYVVSKKGAKSLLEKLPKVSYHVDFQMSHSGINIFAAKTPLATQRADPEESHNASSKKWMNISKIDHNQLDLDFVFTMPCMSLLGCKITTFLIIKTIIWIIFTYSLTKVFF